MATINPPGFPIERGKIHEFVLPPNCTVFTPVVPSSSAEVMRTLPLGTERKGDDSLRVRLMPSAVSLNAPNEKYVEWRACTPPLKLVRVPECAGNSVTCPLTGSRRFHDTFPLNE